MKKYVVFTLALVITIVASATSSENDGNLEIIDYDVNRIAKLQISPEQLANMNTEQLLQACVRVIIGDKIQNGKVIIK